jgi:carboxyl-terminal processing protease
MMEAPMRIPAAWLVCALLPTAGLAQQADTVPLARRAWVASKMYESVQRYFAHWQGVPTLNLDSAYRAYLDEALTAADRRAFDLASLAFLATLENGHTGFDDAWLWRHHGQPLGFEVIRLGGEWVVKESQVDGLRPGDVIRAVDGTAADDFVQARVRYASGSSDAARRWRVFLDPFLFPPAFTLTLGDGRSVRVVPGTATGPAPRPPAALDSLTLAGGVPYLAIRSFGRPGTERAAVAFLEAHAAAPAIVLDVRGNGGGSTPELLIRALMDRPYAEWTEATTMSIALFGAYRRIRDMVSPADLGDYDRGFVDALGAFDRTILTTPGRTIQPQRPVFTGRLAVLIDGGCASACEDFVMPLVTGRRAILVGSTTFGSTGQPYLYDFGDGMSFRVSTKRTSFPDGSPFEGVGIVPDVPVEPTAADLRDGRDPVPARALAALATRGERDGHPPERVR